MEKLKHAISQSLKGVEPTDQEIADAAMEAVDVVASIANSLERLAAAAERDPSLMPAD